MMVEQIGIYRNSALEVISEKVIDTDCLLDFKNNHLIYILTLIN